MNGASGKYVGAIVYRLGTVIAWNVKFAGIVWFASTIPGRMLPTTEPMPGKFDAEPKLPLPPNGVPMRLGNGGAIASPVKPKCGPVAPMNGNCRNACPPTLHGGPAGRYSGLNPV